MVSADNKLFDQADEPESSDLYLKTTAMDCRARKQSRRWDNPENRALFKRQ
jgi:hypothetical protein